MAFISIERDKVIENYLKKLGAVGNVRRGNLEEQIKAFWSSMFKSHQLRWNWSFLQIANEELTTIVGDYLEVTKILVITSARSTSDGGAQVKNDLLAMDWSMYQILINRFITASVDSTYIIKGGVGTDTEGKIFAHPRPAAGAKITVTGIADPDNNPALILTMPISHEEALHRYIDYQLKRGTFKTYEEEVARLGGKELRDMWGDLYGVN